ncbi:hypothetical protein [Actinoplanes sp. NBRC 101535]|uniref:type II toxin-antitoxin system VapC family toxin n=1 Tax=Actinoplanes sp. NBRC 101535 TaxID=3032196 RepID=UPI0024A47ED1|nr:hypothetical protein [Actinoplanes sp. NBRC 101535]GLY00967.1 hypothetical protein Acsp01_13460 [Actinoplanes sp. NBRC 101535]
MLLDCEGLSKLYHDDRTIAALMHAAQESRIRVGTSVMTLLEADDKKVHPARIKWILSRIDVHAITHEIADRAAELLRTHRLHGHKYAIDAVFAAVARSSPPPVTVLTSDPEDLSLLCGAAVKIIRV